MGGTLILEMVKNRFTEVFNIGKTVIKNFLLHFYASYLLASTNLSKNTCKPDNKFNEQDYTVYLNYEIQETSFLKIASKMLNNQPPKKI